MFSGFSPSSMLMIGPFNVKSSFDTILKLHEVMQFSELTAKVTETRTEIPGIEE